MKKLTNTLLIAVIVYGCGKAPVFLGVENVQLEDIKDSLIFFSLDYIALNPNSVNSRLTESEADIFLDGEKVGRGIQSEETTLAKNDTIVVPMLCQLQMSEMIKHLPTALVNKSVTLNIKGKGKVKVLLGTIPVRIDDEIRLDVQKHLLTFIQRELIQGNSLVISDVNMDPRNPRKMKVTLEWTNPYPLDYEIRAQSLQLGKRNEPRSLGVAAINEPIAVKANEKVSAQITFTLTDPSKLIGSGFTLLMKSELDLSLKGLVQIKIDSEIISIPIETYYKLDVRDLTNLR